MIRRRPASYVLAATLATLATGCLWHHDRDVRDPPRDDRHDDHHDVDHHEDHHG
jgi:hypothetical protein